MCWSGEASLVLATFGIASTSYFAYKGEDKRLWLPLGYFTLMEFLQAYTYTVIDDCENPGNQFATLLGYLHIVFQPFFINLFSLHFVPEEVRKRVEFWVFGTCLVGAFFMIVSIYPFEWAQTCEPGVAPFCGKSLCSIHGSWHISWQMPRTIVMWLFGTKAYTITAFVLPLLYGSWRFTLYHFITGPLLAFMTTGDLNEWAAVWCLFSIGLLVAVVKTPIRRWLYVKDSICWRLWGYSGYQK
jgi:hypothetical protein